MQAELSCGGWESLFASVAVTVGRCRKFRLAGLFTASPDLEEMPLLFSLVGPTTTNDRNRSLRAFQVRGLGLTSEGLQVGDYLLIEALTDAPSEAVVLVRVESRYFLRPRSRLVLDPRLKPQILGRFVGIIRRRGFARPTLPELASHGDRASRAATNVRLLRGQLGMLEATCATTTNRRLRDALRNEAVRVRRQLQIDAPYNKLA